jgi:hypothetical protein
VHEEPDARLSGPASLFLETPSTRDKPCPSQARPSLERPARTWVSPFLKTYPPSSLVAGICRAHPITRPQQHRRATPHNIPGATLPVSAPLPSCREQPRRLPDLPRRSPRYHHAASPSLSCEGKVHQAEESRTVGARSPPRQKLTPRRSRHRIASVFRDRSQHSKWPSSTLRLDRCLRRTRQACHRTHRRARTSPEWRITAACGDRTRHQCTPRQVRDTCRTHCRAGAPSPRGHRSATTDLRH